MSNQENKNTFATVDSSTDPQAFVQCLHEQYAHNTRLNLNKHETLNLMDLEPGQIVLDAGCGTGVDAVQMAQLVAPTGHVYGIDFSQEMINAATRQAAKRDLPLTFQQGSIYALKFADNFFDRCRADKTFQHLADPEAALGELIRVTKPGGKIVIADPDHDSLIIDTPYPDITRRFVRFRSDHMAQGGIAHQLYRMFKASGLMNVTVTPLTHVYTSYDEKKASSPYLREIWLAHKHGVVDEDEAERWASSLQEAIDKECFFCMQTYLVTTGEKHKLQ